MAIDSHDLEYLQAHKVYFDQAKLNFIHGMQPHVRNHFEMLYKKYLDKGFILTTWCGQCVVDMMKRLATWYDQQTELKHPEPSTGDDVADDFVFPDDLDKIEPKTEAVPQPAKRRGRPRKK